MSHHYNNLSQSPVHHTPLHRGRGWGWVHFFHNLKIAFRNLLKYKFQTLVSVLALAVGMVTLAATHFVLRYYAPPAICDEPYYDRLYAMAFAKMNQEDKSSDNRFSWYWGENVNIITSDIHNALTSNGGIAGVEKLLYANMGINPRKVSMILPDSTERSIEIECRYILTEYLNFRGIRSALTREKVPVLNYGEAVLTETQAKRICGDQNPVGTKIVLEEKDANGVSQLATYTVRDVVRYMSNYDIVGNQIFLCGEHKDVPLEYRYLDREYEVLLQEGYSMEQLESEANVRLAPLGYKAMIRSFDDLWKEQNQDTILMRFIVYAISSMVLLAALVGFLKMQLQLFHMRRREVLLRTVHGASGKSLYALFMTEVMITLMTSLALALLMSSWLADYAEQHLASIFYPFEWVVRGHHATNLYVFGIIVLLSAFVVWLTLKRIHNANRGLAAGMHRNARHTLRNTILGIQMVVCIVFLGGTLSFLQFTGLIKAQMNIPDNDKHYAECIEITPFIFNPEDIVELEEYLKTNPKGIKRFIKNIEAYETFNEIHDTPGVKEALKETYFLTHYLKDTTFFDFWERPINWLIPEEQRQDCILLSEQLYTELDSLGVIKNGCLTIDCVYRYPTLPVAGTYATLPYKNNVKYSEGKEVAVLYKSTYDQLTHKFIIEPEEGKYQEVMKQMEEVMHNINPLPLKPTVSNLRDSYTSNLYIFKNLQRGAWILSSICLVICLMGIWSTIALDTRSRQKEVALRKVHGAKRGDIAMLFGRLYLWLIGVASILAIPAVILFSQFLKEWAVSEMIPQHLISPVMPLALSIVLTSLVILLVVSLHVRRVVKQKPAEIIAKE